MPAEGRTARDDCRPGSSAPGDAGSAVVEFVTLGVLLLVPLVYLIVTFARVQAATYAADGSARAAGRAFVTAATHEQGRVRAEAAVRLGLLDQGFDAAPGDVMTLTCSASPCLTPQARVIVQVEVPVILPGVPAFVDRVLPTRVTVRARHVSVVDAFRAVGGRGTSQDGT